MKLETGGETRYCVVSHGPDRGRKREHEVDVRHRQKLGCAGRTRRVRSRPLAFWAMTVAAGIIGDPDMRTALTALDMTAQRGGATDLDGCHYPSLRKVQVARVSCAPLVAMAAEDIR
jgi:D-alanyl-D-alanine carboxypeptidase